MTTIAGAALQLPRRVRRHQILIHDPRVFLKEGETVALDDAVAAAAAGESEGRPLGAAPR